MSGLFATLVGAAQGTAPAVEPQPRARFEDGFAAEAGIESHEAEAVRQPEVRAARDDARPADTREPLASAPPSTEAPRRDRPGRPATPARILPRRAAGPLSDAPRRAAPAELENPLPPKDGASAPLGRETERAALAARPTAPAGAAVPLASDLAVTPLLPVAAGPSLRENAPGDPFRSPPDATDSRFDGPLLKIGRIEVRPPAPASAPAPPPRPATVTTRAVIVPRAQVRQSLDDYRASRRR